MMTEAELRTELASIERRMVTERETHRARMRALANQREAVAVMLEKLTRTNATNHEPVMIGVPTKQ